MVKYQPIPIEEVAEGVQQGYSAVLDLNLRWEQGHLGWYDPATGPAYSDLLVTMRSRADRAEAELNAERAARVAAEARIRELEERLRRQRS